MIRFPELPSADLATLSSRPRRRKVMMRSGGARESAAAHGDTHGVALAVRRRLADDGFAGVELSMSRFGSGGLIAAALHHLAGMGKPWSEATLSVVVAATVPCDALLAQMTDLVAARLPVHRLEMVLPEGGLLAVDQDGVFALAALRDRGVGLAIEGFGLAAASLTLLRRLPLTGLKLARSLVRGLPDGAEDAAMVRAVVTMAQATDITVVADGVETERQRAFLAHCGCDIAQGPLFGLPLTMPLLPGGGFSA